jgi:DNA primase
MIRHLPDGLGEEVRQRLTNPWLVLELLGLAKGAVRVGRGYKILCSVHCEDTPSCKVRIGRQGTLTFYCFGCGAKGDVLALIAAARGLSIAHDYAEVLRISADLAGIPLDRGGQRQPAVPLRPARVTPRPHATWRPGEVAAAWAVESGVRKRRTR